MRNWLLILAVLLSGVSLAVAQRISGEVRLHVTDATGAGLHATGSIVLRAAGVDRSFETDAAGSFVLRGLPPGRYELTVRSDGFTAKTISVNIESQLPLEQNVTLEVTPLSTTVEVQEETLLDPVQPAHQDTAFGLAHTCRGF